MIKTIDVNAVNVSVNKTTHTFKLAAYHFFSETAGKIKDAYQCPSEKKNKDLNEFFWGQELPKFQTCLEYFEQDLKALGSVSPEERRRIAISILPEIKEIKAISYDSGMNRNLFNREIIDHMVKTKMKIRELCHYAETMATT